MPNEKRIYILVPKTVQITINDSDAFGFKEPERYSITMEPGRLMAQCCHVGRQLASQHHESQIPHEEITTIVLSVRNSKQLNKVSEELFEFINRYYDNTNRYAEFFDTNPDFYRVPDRVQTAVAVGPIEDGEILDHIIGHLELF